MSDQSQDIINEYKDQIRILKQEVAELQDAGKSKDAANKRCLQKLEYANTDLEKSNNKVKELEKMYKELREQRLEVDRMRRSVQESIDKNASDLDRRLNKFFENAVKELNEKNKKQIYELDKKLNTNKRA